MLFNIIQKESSNIIQKKKSDDWFENINVCCMFYLIVKIYRYITIWCLQDL